MLSVLVVSPDPTVPGGVSVFIACMKRHVMHSRIESFFIGSSGRGGETFFSRLKRLFTAPVALARRVKRQKYDVVHINPSFDTKSLIRDGLFVLAMRAVGFRHIFLYFHGWDFSVQQRIAHNPILRFLAAHILNKAAVISVLDNNFRDGLGALGVDPARITVTRTMFEKTDATPLAETANTRPFILFLSRFDREKGGRELVQAFAGLAKDYPAYDLVLAGDGEDAASMRAQVGNLGTRVRFSGYVGGREKQNLLNNCALFALPTYYRSEGMPIAVLEAMGAGKPLLVGAAGALRSIVTEPDNGVVLDNITVETVEAGLRRLLADPTFAAAAGQRNATIAAAIFDARIVTAEIEQFYQRVASC
jgi:glycosyltransferase involved in cell wall biosynthesis